MRSTGVHFLVYRAKVSPWTLQRSRLRRLHRKIAVIGLTTDDTQKRVMPANIAGVEFRRPAAEAAKLLPELRDKADMVIAATHMGHYADCRHGVNAPRSRCMTFIINIG